MNELFGDIDDIFFESDNLPRPKRQKTEDEQKKQDLELIEQIVNMRKANQVQNTNLFTDTCVRSATKYDANYNLSYNVPKYPFIPITTYYERTIYVRCHSELYEQEEEEDYIKKLTKTSFRTNSGQEVWQEAYKYVN